MNDLTRQRIGRRIDNGTVTPTAVADVAGMVWAHANPAELYRWISRRNALLSTISVVSAHDHGASRRPMAG